MKGCLKILVILIFGLIFTEGFTDAQILIRGKIIGKKDQTPLPGVSVSERDLNNRIVNATISDIDGNFAISVQSSSDTLQISMIGFALVKVVPGSRKNLSIELEESSYVLDDVQIVGQSRNYNGMAINEKDVPFAVQTINTKDLEGVQGASIDDQLQGRLAGLDVVATSGDPGAGMSIKIRGASLLNANSNPLFVIDGVPQEVAVANEFDFGSADEEQYAQMLNIAPEDIKEISILVDAASTARWGTKGANGVILINTKRGTSGKLKFLYRLDYSVSKQPEAIPMLNGDQYSTLIMEEYMNATKMPLSYSIREFQYDPSDPYYYYNYSQNTNWIKEVTQTGSSQSHALSLSGGSGKAKYYSSVNILNQDGTTIGTGYNRVTTMLNLDYMVSNKLRFSTNFSYTHGLKKGNLFNIRDVAYVKMPNMSVYQYSEDGKISPVFFTPESNIQGSSVNNNNPVALGSTGINNTLSDVLKPTFNLSYQMTNNLSYSGLVNFSISNEKTNTFMPQSATGRPWTDVNSNKAGLYDKNNIMLYSNHDLSYNPNIGENNKLIISLGYSITTTKGNSFSTVTYNTPSSFLQDPAVASNIMAGTGGLNSGVGQTRNLKSSGALFYSLLDKYILLGSITREGNSIYSNKNRIAYFPAASIRWRISDESFMSKTKSWLSDLSLRLSYGQTGNTSNVATYLNTYNTYSYQYLDQIAVYSEYPELANLKWITKTEYNLGLDMDISDILQANFNVFSNRIDDQVDRNIQLPSSTGYSNITMNVTSHESKGWEFMISRLKIYSNEKKTIGVDFRFNISSDWTILRKMPSNAQVEQGKITSNGQYRTYNIVGNPLNSFYGFRYKGVYTDSISTIALNQNGDQILSPVYDPSTGVTTFRPLHMRFNYPSTDYIFQAGDAMYEDINKDGNIDYQDVVYLGSFDPKFYGGFGFNFRYKDLSLNLYFTYRYGNKIINEIRMNSEKMYNFDNQSKSVLRRWRNPGDITDIPRALYNQGYNYLGSDRFVEDGSFLKLKSVYINYSLPEKLYKKMHLTSLKAFSTISNSLTWTPYTGADPEVVNYDRARTPRSIDIAFGLTAGF